MFTKIRTADVRAGRRRRARRSQPHHHDHLGRCARLRRRRRRLPRRRKGGGHADAHGRRPRPHRWRRAHRHPPCRYPPRRHPSRRHPPSHSSSAPDLRPHWCHRFPWRCNVHVRWPRPVVVRSRRRVVATTYAVAPAVAAAPRPCTCLTKEYTPDNLVVFKDLCTKEVASAPAGNTQVQLQLPRAGAGSARSSKLAQLRCKREPRLRPGFFFCERL